MERTRLEIAVVVADSNHGGFSVRRKRAGSFVAMAKKLSSFHCFMGFWFWF